MGLREDALELHRVNQGKVAVTSKVKLQDARDLSLAYSPGVAEPCKEIALEPDLSYIYTNRGNMVAVVSDGTAVLGLGDIGPDAALPVMEGKAILFKSFADVDAFPVCLSTKEVTGVVQAVKWLDHAASKGVIHPNNAARRKSRLMKRLAQLKAEAE